MPLPTPKLDDRTFQDLVDEAKRRIPYYCPEWTDHNVSDPGVTLIELFAWMTETLLYRLNRVPEKSYLTFLNLMGVQRQEPQAARVLLVFRLSAPTSEPVLIRAGTEAMTEHSAAAEAVSFQTDEDLLIRPARVRALLTERAGAPGFQPHDWQRGDPEGAVQVFSQPPRHDDAFYIGFSHDLSNHIIQLTVESPIEGIGVDPARLPLSWEVHCRGSWTEIEPRRDTTIGLNQRGQIELYLPPQLDRMTLKLSERDVEAFWLRCRYNPVDDDSTYVSSPRLQTLSAASLGGMVSATHAVGVSDEVLGRSSGQPGQSFQLLRAPVLRLLPPEETVEVEEEPGRWVAWERRDDFAESGEQDRHFQIDYVGGTVMFGPLINGPDGRRRQYGRVPPRGALIRFRRYRSGGGDRGNVGPGSVTRLRSAIPYVDRVSNAQAAQGGRDAETLDQVRLRAPRTLRTQQRAVTAQDFELLAHEASSQVARARCLVPRDFLLSERPDPDDQRPGNVTLLLVPRPNRPEGYLEPQQLELSRELSSQVQVYLDERRLLTTTLRVRAPRYIWAGVRVALRLRRSAVPSKVQMQVLERLYRFVNPVVGGFEGEGWPFGRALYQSDIRELLEEVADIASIERVEFLSSDRPAPSGAAPGGAGEPRSQISPGPHELLASSEHTVAIIG
jgi:predicted phage baseplate assembly protein